MANDWYDEDDENDAGEQVQQNGPANLRKALKGKDAKISELEAKLNEQAAEFTKLSNQLRATTLGDLLKTKGVNPKVAKLVPSDLDPSEESVSQWLTEWADVLNIKRDGVNESTGTDGDQPSGDSDVQDGEDENADEFMNAYGQVMRLGSGNQALDPRRNVNDALDALGNSSTSLADAEQALAKMGFEVGRDVG